MCARWTPPDRVRLSRNSHHVEGAPPRARLFFCGEKARNCLLSREEALSSGLSPIGALKQPAIVRGVVVYEDADGEMAVVPTGPCELETKAGAAPDGTWRDAHGKHCQRGLNEVQVVNYLEAKAPVVKILPTMIYACTT